MVKQNGDTDPKSIVQKAIGRQQQSFQIVQNCTQLLIQCLVPSTFVIDPNASLGKVEKIVLWIENQGNTKLEGVILYAGVIPKPGQRVINGDDWEKLATATLKTLNTHRSQLHSTLANHDDNARVQALTAMKECLKTNISREYQLLNLKVCETNPYGNIAPKIKFESAKEYSQWTLLNVGDLEPNQEKALENLSIYIETMGVGAVETDQEYLLQFRVIHKCNVADLYAKHEFKISTNQGDIE